MSQIPVKGEKLRNSYERRLFGVNKKEDLSLSLIKKPSSRLNPDADLDSINIS